MTAQPGAMIKLTDGCYVAVDQIAELKVNTYGTNITVRTKDGIGHEYLPRYGEGIYAALDRLAAEINAAIKEAKCQDQ